MEIFDRCINGINADLNNIRRFTAVTDTAALCGGYGIERSGGSGSDLVLRADTAIELGGPALGSCAFSIYTDTSDIVSDGRITLAGQDIKDAQDSMSFGQIIIASGGPMSDDALLKFGKYHSESCLIKGYMVKSNSENLWTRVSKELFDKGFDFRFLGSFIINSVKEMFPEINAAEVIFITSDSTALSSVRSYYGDVRKVYQSIKEKKWEKRGINIYECAFHGNCSQCSDKGICDEVNKIAKARKQKMQAETGRAL